MPTFCYACESLRSEDENVPFKEPCPKCGHTMTVSCPPGQEFKLRAEGFRITAKAPSGGKWFSDQRIYHSHYKKNDEHHVVERHIDRHANTYFERIINKETGQVVREVIEPLTEHTGRGSAKNKSS